MNKKISALLFCWGLNFVGLMQAGKVSKKQKQEQLERLVYKNSIKKDKKITLSKEMCYRHVLKSTRYTDLLKAGNIGVLKAHSLSQVDDSISLHESLTNWKRAVLTGSIPFIKAALETHYLHPGLLTEEHLEEIQEVCEVAFKNNKKLAHFLKNKLVKDCSLCLDPLSVLEKESGEIVYKDHTASENWFRVIALPCAHTFHTDCFKPLMNEAKKWDVLPYCPECRRAIDFMDTLDGDYAEARDVASGTCVVVNEDD